jgi:hypothetical protein
MRFRSQDEIVQDIRGPVRVDEARKRLVALCPLLG